VGQDAQGLLAKALADAFAGPADADASGAISTAELYQAINAAVRTASEGKQTPVLVGPQKVIEPRISVAARKVIERLATAITDGQPSSAEAKALFKEAEAAAPGQPEPQLLYGLALLKARQYPEAYKEFAEVRQKHRTQLLAVEGMIWSLFERRDYAKAVGGLAVLVAELPRDPQGVIRTDANVERVLVWAGRLREFATMESDRVPATTLERIDQAIATGGQAAGKAYQAGRARTAAVFADFKAKMEAAEDQADREKLNIDRRRLSHYAAFPFEAAIQRVRDGLAQ
jgi:hypothetical protein